MNIIDLDPRTIEIYEKVKVNLSTLLNTGNILSLSLKIADEFNNGQDKFQIMVSRIYSIKKILLLIGLLKRELNVADNYFLKVNIENKIVRICFKLDEIVTKYNLSYDILKNVLIENDNNFISIIQNNGIFSFDGLEKCTVISVGLIKKYESINLLEKNIDIKNSNKLDIYLSCLYLNKVLEQYLEIIDLKQNLSLHERVKQSISKLNIFVDFISSNDEFINSYVFADFETKENIRRNVRINYIDNIF